MTLKTVFQQDGAIFRPIKDINLPKLQKLPAANYLVKFNPMVGYFLELTESFTLPKKLYGTAGSFAAKIVNTFESRGTNTGVMLAGEKGSGKSMTAKAVCKLMESLGHPTLIINQAYGGDAFNSFLSDINQPCAVFFDEFEKVYFEKEHQHALLTVLDGVFSSRKLFLLTCNQTRGIDPNLSNRPGRLHYWKEYSGLSAEEIREYSNDTLHNKSLVEQVVAASSVFQGAMNFDMLRALVEETNLYPDQKVADHLKILNIQPGYATPRRHTLHMKISGVEIPADALSPNSMLLTPSNFHIRGTSENRGLHISIDLQVLKKLLAGERKPINPATLVDGKDLSNPATRTLVRKANTSNRTEQVQQSSRSILEQLTGWMNPGKTEEKKRELNSQIKTIDAEIDAEYSADDTDFGKVDSLHSTMNALQKALDALEDDEDSLLVSFMPEDLTEMHAEHGRYVFKHKDFPVTLTVVRETEQDTRAAAYGYYGI